MSATQRADLPIGVYVQVSDEVVFDTTIYPGDDLVTLAVGGAGGAGLVLFAERPGLVRLVDALTQALAELDRRGADVAGKGPGSAVAA